MFKDKGNTRALKTDSVGASNTLHLKVASSNSPTAPVAVSTKSPAITEAIIERLPVPRYDEQHIQRDKSLPYNLHNEIRPIRTPSGKLYAVLEINGKWVALPIRSKKLNAILSERARQNGNRLQKADLAELNDALEAYAEQYGEVIDVWLRVAPINGGIEIDLGDDQHTRIRITANRVEMAEESVVVFFRTSNSQAMAMPTEKGDWQLLKKYLNVHASDALLLVAWITYTLAHPKTPSTKFPILVLQGNEGSGKTSLCRNVIIRIIDPSSLGVQVFPQNPKDLAIAGLNAHVLCFDNLRSFKAFMADMLCIAATGGTISNRQLYTDAEQQAIRLHVALVLNGIHSFIDTPDLSQRCLPIHLTAMEKSKRKSEEELTKELEADLPSIMRGLFDLIASIFAHLPNVEITHPERMIDFVAWLGAMERVDNIPAGIYQGLYSEVLQQGQLDTLMDNPLAAAIITFMDEFKGDVWSDTPSELLTALSSRVCRGTLFSREWPQNAIALSKRISGLQAGLLSQGIRMELSRGKQRMVTLSKVEV